MAERVHAVPATGDRRRHVTERTDGHVLPFVRAGAVAGSVATAAFAAVHAALISDIWFSLVPMLVAGALCGACVAWSYLRLVAVPSAGSWLRYNLVYLGLFVALAVVSIAVFQPIATIPELTAMGGAPGDLIAASMPLNLAAVAAGTVLVTRLFGGGRRSLGSVLVTVTVLVLFLGHNVSIIGLVELRAGELYLVAELAGLIFAINAVFVVAFLALERRRLRPRAALKALTRGWRVRWRANGSTT